MPFREGGGRGRRMQGTARCLAGGGGFRVGELRRLFGAEDPTLDLILVGGWSGGGAQGRKICKVFGFCNCGQTLPKLNAHVLRVPGPLLLQPKQQIES